MWKGILPWTVRRSLRLFCQCWKHLGSMVKSWQENFFTVLSVQPSVLHANDTCVWQYSLH